MFGNVGRGEILQPNSARADNCKEDLDRELTDHQWQPVLERGETQPTTNTLLWAKTDQHQHCTLHTSGCQEIFTMGTYQGDAYIAAKYTRPYLKEKIRSRIRFRVLA